MSTTNTDTKITKIKEYQWNIHKFVKKIIDDLDHEVFLETNEFQIFLGTNETSWKFCLDLSKSRFGIYLRKQKADSNNFTVRFEASLHAKDKSCLKTLKFIDEPGKSFDKHGYGWREFMNINDYLNSGNKYIEDGILRIHFEIKLTQESIPKDPECKQCNSELLNLLLKFEDLYESKMFTDFTFVCSDDKEVSAHRNIISMHSTVLRAMLETPMKESKNSTVVVDDIDGETMTEILRFVYTEEVENIKELAPKLLYGAEKYAIDGLKKICSKSMIENLSIDNALEYFILADRYGDKILLKHCNMFIDKNYEILRKQENWKNLDNKMLFLFTDYFKRRYVHHFETSLCDYVPMQIVKSENA